MAAPSKSSQKAKNVAIALLALWSIVSLVVIVVWATSPDLKSSAQCRVELQDNREKLEGAKVVWGKDRVALEEKVEEEREQQARLTAHNLLLLGRLDATNASLQESLEENVVLSRNISLLQEEVEQLLQTEANLTTQLGLKQDHIDALQQNLTQTSHLTESCLSLKDAADSQMVAAQIQTRACESNQQYLQKQLHKCKAVDSQPPQQTTPEQNQASSDKKSAAPPLAGVPVLTLLLYVALVLIPCESDHHSHMNLNPMNLNPRGHKQTAETQRDV